MDLESLRVFRELARSGSMRSAAEALGISPTAVARHLDRIEHRFGTPLVERTRRGVRLTAAGEVLMARGERIAAEIAVADRMIGDLKGIRRGQVSLHINGAASSAISAPALAEFSARYPGIEVEVSVTSVEAAQEAAATGITDFAVTMFARQDARIVTRLRVPLQHEAVMAPNHPLALRHELTLGDLADHPLALPGTDFGLRRAFDARIRGAGLPPVAPTFTTASLELQKELARRGAAILILPAMTVARDVAAGDLVTRPFRTADRIGTLLELSHGTGRPLSLAARQLLDFFERFLSRAAKGDG